MFTANAVHDITNTLDHYSTALQDGMPILTSTVKLYASSLILHFQALFKSSPWPLAGTIVVLYLTLVQIFRFRTVRQQREKYAAYLQDPTTMDYKTAHGLYNVLIRYEAPWIYGFSTQMALVKTYAIAEGTALLVATRQLTQASTVGKRAEDTGVILGEIIVGGLDSDRGLKALSKMNWLHRRYGSRIQRPEMLHTLAMFVLEPIRWMETLEWRPATELEQIAIFTYWQELGSRMGIADIPPTLQALKEWTEVYENKHMYFSPNNKLCAEATLNLFIRDLPPFAQPFAKKMALSCIEPRVLSALGYPNPSPYIRTLVHTIFVTRTLILRHLFLPRFSMIDALPKEEDGRLFRTLWGFEPWYIKASMWEQMKGWFWTGGKVVPGGKYKSNGFLVEELGPVEYEASSREAVLREAAEMRDYADAGGAVGMGCPFKVRL